MSRPAITLFMLMSVDGKISSGDTDDLDPDRDWTRIHGVKEGLWQYYALEQQTDRCFFQSGRVFEKIGINKREPAASRIPVTGVIVDNKPHLNKQGLHYLSSWLEKAIIVTTSPQHPACQLGGNIEVVTYNRVIDFVHLFERLKQDFSIDRMTIQSGGTLDTILLRAGLIDQLSIVVAPLVVAGSGTPTLFDGESIHSPKELDQLKALEFIGCDVLKDSFLHLRYRVKQDTIIDPV